MATDSARSTTNSAPTFVFGIANAILSFLLRSPLHGVVSKSFILLSFKGSKSGKTYTFPVGYIDAGSYLETVSNHSWWKNLRGDAPVTIWFKGQKRAGTAEAFYGDETVANALLPFAQKNRQLVKLYDIEVDSTGQPKPEGVREVARQIALIRIHMTPAA